MIQWLCRLWAHLRARVSEKRAAAEARRDKNVPGWR